MIQGIVIFLSLIIAFFRGGRFLPLPAFKKAWILFLPVILELGTIEFHGYARVLASISYLFIIAFLIINWSFVELRVLLIGVAMNAVVIWVNGGVMPVDHFVKQGDVSYIQFNQFWHSGISTKTIFPLLSDIIYVPFPIPSYYSCGDIFITAGASLLVQRLLGKVVNLSRLAGLR